MIDARRDVYRSIAWTIDPLNLATIRDKLPGFYDGLVELGLLPLDAVEASMGSWIDAFANGANRSRLRSDLWAIASQVRHLATRSID